MKHRIRRTIGLQFSAGLILCGVALSQPPPTDNVQAPPVTGLVPDHATLSVANIELEAEWYGRVLGFKPFSKSGDVSGVMNWHLVIPGYRIDLIQAKGSKRPAPVDPVYHEVNGQMVQVDPIDLQQGWVHVVFRVEDVSAAWKQLQALNVNVKVTKLKDGTPIQLNFRDPEGNAIEIRRNVVV
jgi:catechol 2,3-dioxygenase-like lactoylglutathione lyase family enzyme